MTGSMHITEIYFLSSCHECNVQIWIKQSIAIVEQQLYMPFTVARSKTQQHSYLPLNEKRILADNFNGIGCVQSVGIFYYFDGRIEPANSRRRIKTSSSHMDIYLGR